MEFVNVAILSGLLSLIVPVICHLALRERPKPVTIPTVNFIRQATQRTQSKRKLNNLLLLLARLAILTLFVLALARPVWHNSPFAQGGMGTVAAVLILDDTYYSAQTVAGRSQLSHAKEVARKALEELGDGSRVACFTTSSYNAELTADLAFARRLLDQFDSTTERGDLTRAVAAAAQLLRQQAPDMERVIIVISDLNQTVAADQQPAWLHPDDCRLIIRQLPRRQGNGFIRHVSVRPGTRLVANRPLALTTVVGGGKALSGARVSLRVNGEVQARRGIRQIDGNGSAQVTFSLTPEKAGVLALAVELERPDTLVSDNHWYVPVVVTEAPNILCIGNPEQESLQQADVVASALAPVGWHQRQRFNVERSSSGFVDNHQLNRYDCVILTGQCALAQPFWLRLHRYVSAGGTALLMPDESTKLDRLNAGALPLLAAAINAGHADPPRQLRRDAANALSRALCDRAGGKLLDAQFSQFFSCPLETESANVMPVLWFGEQEAAVIQKQVDLGSCVFWGAPLLPPNSDLMANDALAPVLHELLSALTDTRGATPMVACGAIATLDLPDTNDTEFRVILPDNHGVISLHIDDAVNGSIAFDDTRHPGCYRIQGRNSSYESIFAANIVRKPSDFIYHAPEVEQELMDLAAKGGSADTATPDTTQGGSLPLSPIILLLLAATLMFEMATANRRWGHAHH